MYLVFSIIIYDACKYDLVSQFSPKSQSPLSSAILLVPSFYGKTCAERIAKYQISRGIMDGFSQLFFHFSLLEISFFHTKEI